MRGIISILAGTAVTLATAAALSAQQPARLSLDSAMMKRPALGLQLSPTGSLRDTIGVFVTRVSPKGPAENAGIVEGDRIVSINGVDLRVNSADAGDSYAGDLPIRRLTRQVEKLSPCRVATLRVWSGGRIRDVQVTAARASDLRESGFGVMFGGGPEGVLRSMPGFNMQFAPQMRMQEMPRIPMEELQRMRLEEMPRLRESMDRMKESMRDLPMRLRGMDMAPMRMRINGDGEYRSGSPTRVWISSPNGGHYIYRDSTGSWKTPKTKEERAKAEKEWTDKKNKGDKDDN